MSGGEIARAVLTQNSKWCRPIFYTIAATLSPTPVLGLKAVGTLQTKADSTFLAMGISTAVTRSTGTSVAKQSATFQLTRMSDGYKFFDHPQLEGVNGINLGRQTDLEDYIVLGPSENLQLEVTGLGPTLVITPAFCFLTLSGIEYFM